jgi:hypothetical protein
MTERTRCDLLQVPCKEGKTIAQIDADSRTHPLRLGLARLVPYLSPPAGFYALYRRRGHEGTINTQRQSRLRGVAVSRLRSHRDGSCHGDLCLRKKFEMRNSERFRKVSFRKT